jgi:hypothetical protein
VLLTVDGDQVPEIPFGDVVAKAGIVAPEQYVCVVGKFGITGLEIVTFSVTEVAHWPAFGVKT